MGYVTNYKISFIHFRKTEIPKEADIVNALNICSISKRHLVVKKTAIDFL